MIKIHYVEPGTLAYAAGIQAGDELISINGENICDGLDFEFCKSEAQLELLIHRDGQKKDVFIERVIGQRLGIEPEMTPIKKCRNRCIFCFVHQNPPNMRKTLYIKDEDYRYSFMDGNFVTLSNMKKEDWERILELGLSPLYVSVHATEADLRRQMLGNKKLEPVMERLRWLVENDIEFHTQLVIVPGWNDGAHLDKTIQDLISLYPGILSISIVPVGLTAFREGEPHIQGFTESDAIRLLEQSQKWMEVCRQEKGKNLLFPSDEIYLRARWTIPPPSFYGEYDQFENGVGLLAAFKEDLEKELLNLPRQGDFKPVTILTGLLAGDFQREIMRILKKETGLQSEIIFCENNTFGHSVTVTGLLSGKDYIKGIQKSELSGPVLIPPNSLNSDGLFLDDLSLNDLIARTGRNIISPRTFHNYFIEAGK